MERLSGPDGVTRDAVEPPGRTPARQFARRRRGATCGDGRATRPASGGGDDGPMNEPTTNRPWASEPDATVEPIGDDALVFIGNATVLLRYAGFTILTDPNFVHAGEEVP